MARGSKGGKGKSGKRGVSGGAGGGWRGRFVLVDGHSVIHAWPELRDLHQRGEHRHQAREVLMRELRAYQDAAGVQVVVVFDGRGQRLTEEREPGGLQVVYAPAGKTADDIIERLVAEHGEQHDLTVVTADMAERMTVEAFGAHWVGPETFRGQLDALRQGMRDYLERRRRREG
jgi:uncharacterized protein